LDIPLIYLDALVLEDGESAFSRLEPAVVAERVQLAQQSSKGLTMLPPPPSAFGVTETQDAAWLQRRLTPHPLKSYQAPIVLNHPLGNGVKQTYIACTRPAYAPLVPTQEWVRRQSAWQYLELASGHDAMVMHPEALAEVLVGCAPQNRHR
jgi:hypothetical protein